MKDSPNLLEVSVFFRRIGIIKTHNQLTVESLLVILIQ